MEKALLMDIKKFAVHDGPGIRTTFFLKGCPLKCVWCHNPEGISEKPELAYYEHKCLSCGTCTRVCPNGAHAFTDGAHVIDRDKCDVCGECADVCPGEALRVFGRPVTVGEAVKTALEDRVFYETSGGGVTVSGGEPLLEADFVREFFLELKSENISTAVDTCGCVPWMAFEKVLDVTDIFLYDVKHIDPARHKELTRADNRQILENLKRLSDAGKRIEIRMPFVPGCNSDDAVVRGIGDFLGKLRIERMKVLPYHSMARSKYTALGKTDTMPCVDPPDDAMLLHAIGILRKCGVNAVSGRE